MSAFVVVVFYLAVIFITSAVADAHGAWWGVVAGVVAWLAGVIAKTVQILRAGQSGEGR